MDSILNTLRSLGRTILSPFGVLQNREAQANLAAQQNLASQIDLARNLDQARKINQDFSSKGFLPYVNQAENRFYRTSELEGGDFTNPYQELINEANQNIDNYFKNLESVNDRAAQFERDNPFSFDEALARASAEELYDPYFDAELNDFITGIENQRQRSAEDESKLQRELNTQTENYVGKARRTISDALESAKEGFAGAGLYFSGKRVRREGRINLEGEEDIGEFERQQGLRSEEARTSLSRTVQDLDLRRSTGERRLGAERTTAVETDIARQRENALRQREFERQQFIGAPLATGVSSYKSLYGV